jgi:hypothetical protein
MLILFGGELLAHSPTLKLQEYPFSDVRDYLISLQPHYMYMVLFHQQPENASFHIDKELSWHGGDSKSYSILFAKPEERKPV